MPFALLVLSGDGVGPVLYGQIGAALAFLLVGAGLHTTQTAGLALATDLATPATRARVVALLYVTLLVGMVASGLVFAWLLADFTPLRLIQVVQGAAVVTMALNVIALWKQEVRNPARTAAHLERPTFRTMFRQFVARPRATRFLVAVALGTAAFNMQDIILEPYGAQVLKLSVSGTTVLTALLAVGSLAAFALAARALAAGVDPYRLAGLGLVSGLIAFPCVMFAGAIDAPGLFRLGTVMIGFGGGLFSVSTLTIAMELEEGAHSGLAVGIWGAVQASSAGLAIRARRRRQGWRRRSGRGRCVRPCADRPRRRLQRRLSHRGRAAVRHAGRHRPAGAQRRHDTKRSIKPFWPRGISRLTKNQAESLARRAL